MEIGNLDNEVYFKHVFTNIEVFQSFVKDILDIEVNVTKVETEKVLPSSSSPIKFRMDLFAEDVEKRVIIEIQKVDYDYTYDRFSHYFYANLVDLQKSSKKYAFDKDVYVIVVITSAYKISEKNGQPIKDDVLITDTNPRTLQNVMRDMNNHKMVFLNTVYANEETPANIKDWLDLITESMKNNQDLEKINRSKKGIAKAVDLAKMDDLSPEELAEAKLLEMEKAARALRENTSKEEGIQEGIEIGAEQAKIKGIKKALKRGKLTVEEIAEDFEVTVDYVLEIKKV
jgi:predicted transposase/invertase (TIGR01784 family)